MWTCGPLSGWTSVEINPMIQYSHVCVKGDMVLIAEIMGHLAIFLASKCHSIQRRPQQLVCMNKWYMIHAMYIYISTICCLDKAASWWIYVTVWIDIDPARNPKNEHGTWVYFLGVDLWQELMPFGSLVCFGRVGILVWWRESSSTLSQTVRISSGIECTLFCLKKQRKDEHTWKHSCL